MKTKLLFILLSLLVASCTKDDITPPDDTPKKQVDIPWPSLAKSPWPMNHGNPQGTGRSSSFGPATGTIQVLFDSVSMETGVSIGPDSTIYFGTILRDISLYAIKPNGTLKWKRSVHSGSNYANSGAQTTPLIDAQHTIYVGAGDGYLYAYTSSGVLKWSYNSGAGIFHQGMALGLDTTIYFVNYTQTLYAMNPQGTLKWSLTDSRIGSSGHLALTFSPDGKRLYMGGTHATVLAIDVTTHSIAWTFGNDLNGEMMPVVDCDGNIYVVGTQNNLNNGMPSLYSLNSDGSVRWAFVHNNPFSLVYGADPCIDQDGNIYFALDTLYAVGANGTLKWKKKLNNYSDCPLVCDASGRIYVASSGSDLRLSEFLIFNQSGEVLAKTTFPRHEYGDSSPAIGYNSQMILASWRGTSIFSIY
jgi:outer membrane protein assembly factor BamB